MQTRLLALSTLVFGTLVAGGQALAADTHAMANACRQDFRQLCPSVQPGGGRVLACLKEHEAQLSPPCKTQLETLASCAPEIQKICGTGDPSALRSCLKTHAAELSAACRPAVGG